MWNFGTPIETALVVLLPLFVSMILDLLFRRGSSPFGDECLPLAADSRTGAARRLGLAIHRMAKRVRAHDQAFE
jgi:hypothetical protein